MVKNILLVVAAFLVGLGGAIGIYLSLTQQHPKLIISPVRTSFSLEKAPRDTLVGSIASLSGGVSWQSRVADTPSPIMHPHPLQQGENVVTGNSGAAIITFPTVFTATMSANAQLNIIQTLPASVVVQQTQGQVIYKKTGSVPLSVRGLDLLLLLTDGQAEVAVDSVASRIGVIVKTGSVTAAYTNTQNISKIITIFQGQQLLFDDNTKKAILE